MITFLGGFIGAAIILIVAVFVLRDAISEFKK